MATVKAKKKCCKDRPRCKECPVVLKRLADAGLLERESKRRYTFDTKPPKSAVSAARAA
ncbi:hypothetical protein [Jiangella aurantiaca]|uniref:hypothetical protein n=1 Tax=Jiangella aurantiaca TaxID=2530373 RepID=UPI00193EBE83|nr:hypothetical protein [Jiangella aurantiaca]